MSRPALDRESRDRAAVDAPLPELGEPGDDPVTGGHHRGWLAAGLVLAGGATVAVFFTDDPLYLRVALLAVCWAFLIAAFVAGGRRADQAAAAAREAELRHAYDLELEREVAARHEHQLQLESRLRQESEQAMRDELGRLRTELAGLAELKDDLAAVTELRTELTALAEVRGELAGLGQVRAELAGLAELRADLGRMRSELTDQLSGELLVERMVMRAQSVRGPAQSSPDAGSARPLDVSPWESPAVAWDVDHWESTRVDLAAPAPADPAPRVIAAPPPVPPPAVPPRAAVEPPPSPLAWLVEESVLEPWVEPSPKSPLEWLGDRALIDDARPQDARQGLLDGAPGEGARRDEVRPDEALLHEVGRSIGGLPAVPPPVPPREPVAPVPSREPEPAVSVDPPRRRHRRAAEPDDEGTARPIAPRRSHAADEETPGTAADRTAPWTPSVSAVETPSETPWWESSAPSQDPAPAAGGPAAVSSAGEPPAPWDSPSWGEPSWQTPSETPSWATRSVRSSASPESPTEVGPGSPYVSSAAGAPQGETPSWSTPSWEGSAWGTTTEGASRGSSSWDAPRPEASDHGASSGEAASAGAPSWLASSEPAPGSGARAGGKPSWGESQWDTSSSEALSDGQSSSDAFSYGASSETPPSGFPAPDGSADGARWWENASDDEPSWRRASDAVSADPTPSTGATSWSGAAADPAGDAWSAPSWSAGPAEAPPAVAPPVAEPPAQGHARLEQILAESGVEAPSGARSRRRRYREEGEDAADDVLARVLGQR
ncbi:DUF6779 domain-containing protein [Modestobacter italicus]|uniref:DUF6779 domain-containing protein n=1 Tax=Modestobacter italicus (strain DSM 44449 / CECT 9708 / BC 501) TaxID=2732864 RepID=UPI001C9592A5|nr:DUF6779 domain-containing protein [Modestobacter italicus]